MVVKSLGDFNKQTNQINSDTKSPINLTFDIRILNIICRYVLQPNSLVKLEHLINVRRLFNALDYSLYQNDPDKMNRIGFIFKALEVRLDEKVNDLEMILVYINGGLTYKVDFIDYDNIYMNKNEVQLVHGMISQALQYQFMYPRADELIDLCTEFKASTYENRGNIIERIEACIDNTKNDFRRSKVNNNSTEMVFSLRDGTFESAVTETYNIVTNPNRKLRTGMQGFNEMLGGGFENTRVYMLFGSAAAGKSITILNLMYQIKKYNTTYVCKDPTKKPCIVLLTMENSVVETITRLYDLVIENSNGMENCSSAEEAIHKLRTEGGLFINDSSPIDIIVTYQPNKSKNTSYLYTLCDDLEDIGYEVIMLFQDHVKRIRSVYTSSGDLRLELGDVVNEFKTFAIDKDIPVLSNSHLNRDAARVIEDAALKHNQDLARLVGKSGVGESLLMVDNLDGAYVIVPDYDDNGHKYMGINAIKSRVKDGRTYIAQPFAIESNIRLLEDIGGIPQFRENIHQVADMNMNNSIVKISGSSIITNSIDDIIEKDDDNTTFSNKTLYNLAEEEEKEEPVKPIEFITVPDIHSNIMNFKESLKQKEEAVCPIIIDRVS